MSRARMMVGMLVLTLAAVIGAVMFGGDWERPAEARIVTVEKGDIRLVAALSGRLAYQDETVAFSVIPGIVDEILVREGERVAKGQALIRLKEDGL
ncbi:MAG: biotin/lipoyl-binding protein [Clostridia bacterium]|nr:biotin/lipoyl-binding protein [Clostridia bacterium]